MLWPDNGEWYRATVEEIAVKNMTAELFYEDTEEQETANLAELIEEGQIAFSTCRSGRRSCRSCACHCNSSTRIVAHINGRQTWQRWFGTGAACAPVVIAATGDESTHSCSHQVVGSELCRQSRRAVQAGGQKVQGRWSCRLCVKRPCPVGPCAPAEEEREIGYECNSDEIELDEKYFGKQQGAAGKAGGR